jgi:hypothetical protein
MKTSNNKPYQQSYNQEDDEFEFNSYAQGNPNKRSGFVENDFSNQDFAKSTYSNPVPMDRSAIDKKLKEGTAYVASEKVSVGRPITPPGKNTQDYNFREAFQPQQQNQFQPNKRPVNVVTASNEFSTAPGRSTYTLATKPLNSEYSPNVQPQTRKTATGNYNAYSEYAKPMTTRANGAPVGDEERPVTPPRQENS